MVDRCVVEEAAEVLPAAVASVDEAVALVDAAVHQGEAAEVVSPAEVAQADSVDVAVTRRSIGFTMAYLGWAYWRSGTDDPLLEEGYIIDGVFEAM